jgi:hypothetical protein
LNDDVVTNEPVSIVVPAFIAYDAVVANELLIATDALSAQLAVPINDPLNEPVLYELVKLLKLDVVTTLEVKALKEAVVTSELVSTVCGGRFVNPLPLPTKLPVNEPVL